MPGPNPADIPDINWRGEGTFAHCRLGYPSPTADLTIPLLSPTSRRVSDGTIRNRFQKVLDSLARRLGLLKPEAVAGGLEDSELSARDTTRDQAGILPRNERVVLAGDHQGRAFDLGQAIVGIEGL